MKPAKPLVIIIEDDPASAEALALILRDWGAEVLHGVATAPIQASLAGRDGEVRWIITDFHLGEGADGVTVVRELTAKTPNARVLVLTGSFQGRAGAVARDAGFEVMEKPALAKKIVDWLER